MSDMKIQTAIQVLEKDAQFMGIAFEQILIFVERNPYAVPRRVLDAFGVYKKDHNAYVDELAYALTEEIA